MSNSSLIRTKKYKFINILQLWPSTGDMLGHLGQYRFEYSEKAVSDQLQLSTSGNPLGKNSPSLKIQKKD